MHLLATGNLLLVLILSIGTLHYTDAHPIPTFYMTLCHPNGTALIDQYYGGNFTTGTNETIYFSFQDMEHNLAIVPLGLMMPIHKRFIHVLVVSKDTELTAHTHPDDFIDMYTLPNTTTLFSVQINFPKGGSYSIAANFMFNDLLNKTYRDGFAQTEFGVVGSPLMDPTPVRNYNQTNRYALWNFSDAPREILDGWIDTTKNYDSEGYWGVLRLAINGTLLSGQNTNITMLDCTFFTVTMYNNSDTMSTPAPMLPLMVAPVHFTLVNYDGAVYHSHGMYLPHNTTFQSVLKELSRLTMAKMGTLDPLVDPIYNLSMSASMIGVTADGYIDCFTDEGKVMYDMDEMAKTMPNMKMDMNEFYGPSEFNIMASIFNFPNGGNWRIYAWMKILDNNGNERLIVPHWDVYVDEQPTNNTMSTSPDISGAASWSLTGIFGIVIASLALSL